MRGLGFLFTQSEKQMPRFVRIFVRLRRWRRTPACRLYVQNRRIRYAPMSDEIHALS